MDEQRQTNLFGSKGIDTTYERDLITYRPKLKFSKQEVYELLPVDLQQSIERSKTFTIAANLNDYDELIAEVNQMLADIEARASKGIIEQLKGLLANKQYKEIASLENANSGYSQSGDYEIYSMLTYMKDSMNTRRDFIDDKFRTQITRESDVEQVETAEMASISEWEQMEAKVMDAYKRLNDLNEIETDDDSSFYNEEDSTYDELALLEKQKRNKELLHTTLADTSYVHRNRYFMFLNVIETTKTLVYEPASLIAGDLRDLILQLESMSDYKAAKSHLILQFKKIKDQHMALKGRILTLDDGKETFASEKQYLYQQLEVKTVEPLKEWLTDQEEGVSDSLDLFSGYITDSLKSTRTSFKNTNGELLNFYQSESDFYEQQVLFLKNKEEIRRFLSILEDLEDVVQIQESWVDEYLKTNGYA